MESRSATLSRQVLTFFSQYKFLLAALTVLSISLLYAQSAFAGINENSRLHYGNVGSYCSTDNSGEFAKGMVWLANDEGDYYSETVLVGTDANSVRVSIRGAVNSCRTNFSPGRDMYAINVSATVLTGLSSNNFYRGYVAGTWNWTTQGSKLYGDLNVSGVARCDPSNMSGRAYGTVTVFLTRQQQQMQGGRVVYTSPDPGTEPVPVNVVRTCPTYNYSLVPTINVPDNDVIELPVTNKAIDGSVRNNGPTISRNNPEWRITKLRYSKTVTSIPQKSGGVREGAEPCSYFTGEIDCDDNVGRGTQSPYYNANDSRVHGGTTNISNYEIGTRICFAMSVRQYNQSAENWRHSNLSCYIVGKTPKVNVLGGDLLVGRSGTGIPAPTSARIITGQTQNARGLFTSWGEYAVTATGQITSMTSGSGSVGGNTTNVNLLTFVNSDQPDTSPCRGGNGCYSYGKPNLPDIGARFRTSSTTASIGSGSLTSTVSGVYTATGALEIESSTIGTGRSIVINAPTADVTIKGNVRYTASSLSGASQIPQLVIIANSITINEGVENVDAWLVAPGRVSGGSVVGGVIRTCNRATANISQDVCDRPLTVNGPIIANRLIMLRTGGAGGDTAAGNPAEVFNFRPDAYMWALSQAETGGRVTTVSTKELPPRY